MTSHEELGYQSSRSKPTRSTYPQPTEHYSEGKIKLHKGQRPAWLSEDIYDAFCEGILLTLANNPKYWPEIKDNSFLLDLLKKYLSRRLEAFKTYMEERNKNENPL